MANKEENIYKHERVPFLSRYMENTDQINFISTVQVIFPSWARSIYSGNFLLYEPVAQHWMTVHCIQLLQNFRVLTNITRNPCSILKFLNPHFIIMQVFLCPQVTIISFVFINQHPQSIYLCCQWELDLWQLRCTCDCDCDCDCRRMFLRSSFLSIVNVTWVGN